MSMEQLENRWTESHEICHWEGLAKFVHKFKLSFTSNNNANFTQRPTRVLIPNECKRYIFALRSQKQITCFCHGVLLRQFNKLTFMMSNSNKRVKAPELLRYAEIS
jgi:hypothetical protein